MQTLDWSEMIGIEKPKEDNKLYPYCSSIHCDPKLNGTTNGFGVLKKNVKKRITFCPDCGSALFWGKYYSKHATKYSYRKRK